MIAKRSPMLLLGLALLLWSAPVAGQCAEGCIKCGSDASGAAACEICDLFSSFYMDAENKCVLREIENCLVPSSDQSEYFCAQCKQGFVLDGVAAKCVEVPSAKKIANCRQYTLVGTCKHCFQHYFLDGSECRRVGVIIENCRTYFGDDLCEECVDNYHFDVATNKCVAFESLENCRLHTFKRCRACREGFYLNSNASQLAPVDKAVAQHVALELWEGVNFAKNWVSTCAKLPDSHCLEVEPTASAGKLTNACKACKPGYFLSSGKCEPNPGWAIKNCKTYFTPEVCSECAAEFYLDCNECKQRGAYESCETPDKFADRCYRCLDTHYLDSSGACQTRTNGAIEQCAVYFRTADYCDTCKDGHVRSNDFIECFAEIVKCLIYEVPVLKADLKLTCKTCDSNHYLTEDKTQCNPQNKLNCKTYESSSSNICTHCNPGYYLDQASNVCLEQDVANCRDYAANSGNCDTCEDFHRSDGPTTCTPFTIPDCIKNVENQENCERCNPHRFLKSVDGKTLCVAVVKSLEADFCSYSESTDELKGCSMCASVNKAPLDVMSDYHVKELPAGCRIVYSYTEKCYGCKDNMDQEVDNDSVYTCTQASDLTVPCLQLKYSQNSFLSANEGTCGVCRNYETHYIRFGICHERASVFKQNCQDLLTTREQCEICKEGFSGKESPAKDGPICQTNPAGFAAMTGCAVYNIWEPSKCVKCEWEYSLSGEGTCVLTANRLLDTAIKNRYDHTSKTLGNDYLIFNLFTKSVTGFKTANNFGNISVECLEGYVKMLHGNNYGYNYETKGIFSDSFRISCQKDTDWAQKDDGNGGKTPYVTGNECELVHVTMSTKFCIKCKNNMKAKYLAAKYDKDGNNILDSNLSTVESCTPASDTLTMSKAYKAHGFRRDDRLSNKTMFEEEIFYDTCDHPDQHLVLVLSKTTNFNGMFRVNKNQAQAEERAFCYDFGSSPPAHNCHLMATDYNSPDFNYLTGEMFCIACKPGYAATNMNSSDYRKIETCTKIDNCDTSDSAKNTWANACETCKDGHVYMQREFSGKTYLDISTCKARTKTNCLVENINDECVVCDVGFVIDNNNCVAISPSVPNCLKNAFNSGQIADISYDLSDKYETSFNAFIQNKFESISARLGCAQCADNHSLFGLPNGGSEISCESNQTLTTEGAVLVADCKIFSGEEENTCLECKDTHILDNSNACVLKSSLDSSVNIDHCKVLDSAADPKVCKTCADDAQLNSSTNECVRYNHCLSYSQDGDQVICQNCEDGKMVDYRDKTLCIDIIIPNCAIFSNNACSQCESGYSKINFTGNKSITFCVKDRLSDSSLNGLDYSFHYNLSSGIWGFNKMELQPGNTTHYLSKIEDELFTRQICPYGLNQECANKNNVECTACLENHWLDQNTMVCIPNTILNCKNQASLYECQTCETGYFVNPIKHCQKQNVDDCEQYLSSEAGCSQCTHAHYLQNKRCYPHTVENCNDYGHNLNTCDECKDFFYLVEGKCVAHTVSGCKNYSKNEDACASCHERYYIDGGKCKINTAKNCKTFDTHANECTSCFFESGSTHVGLNVLDEQEVHCVPVEEVQGCSAYETGGLSRGQCTACSEGYFPHGDACLPFPTGVRFCAEFASVSSCTRCISGYFVDASSGECKPVYKPIEHCADYSAATDCKECREGYLLSADFKTCAKITENSCKTFATFDSCATCEESMGLEETAELSSDGTSRVKKCVSGIADCLKLKQEVSASVISDTQGGSKSTTAYSYTCEECAQGKVLSSSGSSCESPTPIANCMDYSADGLCSKCNQSYWLAKDKKACSHDNLLNSYGCQDAYVDEAVTCNVCASGYMMDAAGACVECGGEGCAICDAESSSSCSLCGPGYYMTQAKTCSKNENYSFSLTKEEIAGGDSVGGASGKLAAADEGREGGENFGMKVSALAVGLAALLTAWRK